jgi:uncharacterized membrane protein
MKKKAMSVSSLEENKEATDPNHLGMERLVFFSDAVFAIAITILVLEIRLPAGTEASNDIELFHTLVGLWHQYLAYVISFFVIGNYWISHHRKFLLIRRFDILLLLLNLLLLMVIAFIPFPTAVISENGNRTATIFYALVMSLAGLMVAAIWWHASSNNHLVDPHLDRQRLWRETAAPLATVAVFLLSIVIAFFDETVAKLFWVLILPVSLFANRGK